MLNGFFWALYLQIIVIQSLTLVCRDFNMSEPFSSEMFLKDVAAERAAHSLFPSYSSAVNSKHFENTQSSLFLFRAVLSVAATHQLYKVNRQQISPDEWCHSNHNLHQAVEGF